MASPLVGKDALLHWCRERTGSYRSVRIENFSASFQSGLAFVALIHSQWPEAVPHPDSLEAGDALANAQLAFDAGEKQGISALLDAELVTSMKPDAKTVMTYVALVRKTIKGDARAEPEPAAPARAQSMPLMRVGSAKDDVAQLLQGVDLSTLKRPSPRPKPAATATTAEGGGASPPAAGRTRPRSATGPPAIPKKKPPSIPKGKGAKGKRKAVIPTTGGGGGGGGGGAPAGAGAAGAASPSKSKEEVVARLDAGQAERAKAGAAGAAGVRPRSKTDGGDVLAAAQGEGEGVDEDVAALDFLDDA